MNAGRGADRDEDAPHLAEPTPRLPPTPQRASPKAPGDGLLPRAASKDRTPINAAQARSRLRGRTMRVFPSPRWRQLHARSRVEQKAASRAAPPPLPQQARCDRAASRRSRGPRPARASLAILYRPRRTKAWNAESPLRKSGGCLWANEQPRANAWRANDGSRRHEGRLDAGARGGSYVGAGSWALLVGGWAAALWSLARGRRSRSSLPSHCCDRGRSRASARSCSAGSRASSPSRHPSGRR